MNEVPKEMLLNWGRKYFMVIRAYVWERPCRNANDGTYMGAGVADGNDEPGGRKRVREDESDGQELIEEGIDG